MKLAGGLFLLTLLYLVLLLTGWWVRHQFQIESGDKPSRVYSSPCLHYVHINCVKSKYDAGSTYLSRGVDPVLPFKSPLCTTLLLSPARPLQQTPHCPIIHTLKRKCKGCVNVLSIENWLSVLFKYHSRYFLIFISIKLINVDNTSQFASTIVTFERQWNLHGTDYEFG